MYINYIDIVITIAIVGISGFFYPKRMRDRDEVQANQEDDVRKEEYFKGMLKEGEILEACASISHDNRYYCAVTDRRMFIESKNVLDTVSYSDVKKIKFVKFNGDKTRKPDDAIMAKIKAGKNYSVYGSSGKFKNVVECLMRYNPRCIA